MQDSATTLAKSSFDARFGRPALSRVRAQETRRGIIYHSEPFRLGRQWCVRCVVQIEGILIRNVTASANGVNWPSIFGDPMLSFVDADLQERAETAIKRHAAMVAESMRADSVGGRG